MHVLEDLGLAYRHPRPVLVQRDLACHPDIPTPYPADHATVWEGPDPEARGRGFYLIGSQHRVQVMAARIRKGYGDARVVADLLEWRRECDRPEKVLDLVVADESQRREYVSTALVITDDHLYTEFPLCHALFDRGNYNPELNGPQLRRDLAQVGRGQ